MNNDKITLIIDGIKIEAEKNSTILQTALDNGIFIPNLCTSQELKPWGACRLCMVENNEGRLITACENLVEEDMIISTETPSINTVRKLAIKLLIANHEMDCLTCAKDGDCRLQDMAAYMDIDRDDLGGLRRRVMDITVDESNPFFIRDLKKCIVCGICVRVCSDIVGANAIDFGFRSYETKIIASNDKPILQSSCISCGECVVACPVGALVPKNTLKPSREIKTICSYCGVGCGIYLGLRGNEIVNVRGDPSNPANEGNLCVKGRFGHSFVTHPERMKSPLIKKEGIFQKASWSEAFKLISERLLEYRKQDNVFATMASAKCTNEENYVLQKFTRTVMNTNNIDHCARLCHAASVSGLGKTVGSGAMTNSIEEIIDSDCIFAIGTNTTSTHPIIGMKIQQAVHKGASLIVANPIEIELCKYAEIFLQHNPGTDVALLMGIIRVIIDENLLDTQYIADRCENFVEFKESLKKFDLDLVEGITGVKKSKIIKAANIYAKAGNASILYAMGITQHSHGTDNVMAISNLALITGNVGKSSSGINPLRGQNNVQGSCDMGSLPDVFTGYQKVDDPYVHEKFEKAWGYNLDISPGMMLQDIITAAYNGDIKSLYIMGENPVLSEPDSKHVIKALKKLEFMVVQDIFMTETALLADVVLPACTFAEKDGTFTNTERRVQLLKRAIEPFGDSNPDWWIICQLAKKMGFEGFDFENTNEIMEEIARLTPSYGGISHSRLEHGGLQWPCFNNNDLGTKVLHLDKFNTDNGKGKLISLSYKPPLELPDVEYPLILTTGRSLYQYHTRTMSGRIEGLDILYGHEVVEINPIDANSLGICSEDIVIITSRRGSIKAHAKLTESIPNGLVAMTFHFPESPTNVLTNPVVDPISGTPELKYCSVRIDKADKIDEY
jgi:formate dehydrogenase (NADP+) alpha subunit